DSILSAIALTNGVGGFACRTATMAVAIVLSGLGMILLADTVSEFLKKNRMYEILGLFVLFIVGVMLITEGGHDSHLAFFGYAVEKMNKSTFYFVLAMLVLVDMAQSRYQKRLLAMAEAKRAAAEESVT
ncbi:MAG: tellurium resistance protein TerC, partial [Planctomycetota bacterium]